MRTDRTGPVTAPWLVLACTVALAASGCDKETKAPAAPPPAPTPTSADLMEDMLHRQESDVKALNARIARLEGDVESLQSQLESGRREKNKTAGAPASAAEIQNQTPAAAQNPAPHEMTAEEKLAAYEARGIQGVPTQIATQIIASAKEGRNSAWQTVLAIEREGAGYLAYVTFANSTTTMPRAVRDSIMTSSHRESPNSWALTADKIKDETDAWNTVQTWKADVVPGLTRQQSLQVIASVVAEHPNDWSRVVFDIGRKAKRLTR